LKRVGADYIRVHYDAKAFPAHPALERLVRERMVSDMAKLKKVPSEKDIRLAYLQTEYNLGRISLFNRDRIESKNPQKIRAAALSVAAHLTDAQAIAMKTAPRLYDRYMRFEPGVLEAEGITLYLMENDPVKTKEYHRIYQRDWRSPNQFCATWKKMGGDPLSLTWIMSCRFFQPKRRAGCPETAREYNAVRDLAMLALNLKENNVMGPDGRPYSPQSIVKEFLHVEKRVAPYRLRPSRAFWRPTCSTG
jgi:hypothetical protein